MGLKQTETFARRTTTYEIKTVQQSNALCSARSVSLGVRLNRAYSAVPRIHQGQAATTKRR